MIIIGLTGGIGAGKSTASSYLKSLGAAVWDADALAREIEEPGRTGWQAVRREFGEEFFDEQGNLLRGKLADHVFGDAEALKKLNALLHPIILEDMFRWIDKSRAEGVPVSVIDAPLLFESGADKYVNEIWLLSCGAQEQINRLMQRGLTRESAEKRLEAQMSDRERRMRANRVITTGGSVEETHRQLKALYEQVLSGEI
jgi:dephospho-CoA kinase